MEISSFLKKKIRHITRSESRKTPGQYRIKSSLADESSVSLGSESELRPLQITTNESDNNEFAQQFVTVSVDLQLELIKKALNLTSAVLLWAANPTSSFVLQGFATDRDDILTEPFPVGKGVTGALVRNHTEVSMVDVSPTYHGLPYYIKAGGVGSLFAVRLPEINFMPSASLKEEIGVLCVDRIVDTAWTETEKNLLRMVTNKLAMEMEVASLCRSLDQEKDAIQTICDAFRELNRGLGLDSVFAATAKAVKNFVKADFIAISLADAETHNTAFAIGNQADDFLGMEYDISDGLVGKVLKLQHSLPANASYNGPAPVFSHKHSIYGYNSLFIVPLRQENNQPLGTLTVAALEPEVYGKSQQDILELIADQVAIKIDLAKSHEKINKMATTDGLTELANHRTFQHGFDVMLHRAKRRESPLSLIFCDIDFFKKINDKYGHPFGDMVLKSVSKILSDAVRKEDLAARYGGEEFAIVLENSDKKGAFLMAERIRSDIAGLVFPFENRKVNITISLGISSFPDDGQDKSDIIENADQALYAAKGQGRNQTIVWQN